MAMLESGLGLDLGDSRVITVGVILAVAVAGVMLRALVRVWTDELLTRRAAALWTVVIVCIPLVGALSCLSCYHRDNEDEEDGEVIDEDD